MGDNDTASQYFTIFRFPFLLGSMGSTIVILVLTFSSMGFGLDVHQALAKNNGAGGITALTVGFIGLISFVALKTNSKSTALTKLVIPIAAGVGIVGVGLGCLYVATDFPAALLAMAQLGPAMLVFGLHQTFFFFLSTPVYFREARLPLNIVGGCVGVAWIIWIVVQPAPWTTSYESKSAAALGCSLDNTTYTPAHYQRCPAAYVLWFFPMFICISTFCTSLFLGLLNHSVQQTGKDSESSADQMEMDLSTKVLGILFAVTLAGIWVLSSFGGSSPAVWDGIAMMAVMNIFIIGAVMTYSAPHASSVQEQVNKLPLMNKMDSLLKSDSTKGAFALVSFPAVVCYLSVRHVFCNPTRLKKRRAKEAEAAKVAAIAGGEDTERKNPSKLPSLDLSEYDLLNELHWGKILQSTVFLGTVFMILFVVIGKLTNIILSKLNEHLAQYPLGTVLVLWYVVGVLMFTVAIPGVPVYVTGGVIVTTATINEDAISYAAGSDTYFWAGLFLSTFICLLIKLSAVVIQQKVIGEIFGRKVSVRRMVGVNSITIRAIKAILSVPGLSARKSAILCGGPDWPTSVLTGILRLPLLEMLVGTLPVYIVMAPCCAAGAMMIKAAEGGAWGTISATTLTAASFGQGFALCSALYFIEEHTGKHRKELEAMPDDEEVKALDDEQSKIEEIKNSLTAWDNPLFKMKAKSYLVGSACCLSTAVYIYALFPNSCFKEFAVTDSIERDLNGNALSVVKPAGWVALVLFFTGVVLSKLFSRWVDANMPTPAGSTGEKSKQEQDEVTPKSSAAKFVV